MILGIIASEDVVPAADVMPSRASLDFGSGIYQVDGETVALGDIVDHTENVVPGFGLILGFDHMAELLGSIATLLASGNWTVALEWWRGYNFATPIEVNDGAGGPTIRIEDRISLFLAFDSVSGGERDLLIDPAPGEGERGVLHCAAFTRTDDKLVVSLDQDSIISDHSSSPAGALLTNAYVGGFGGSYGSIVLRRMKIYDPVGDEALQTLIAKRGDFPVAPNDDFANAQPIYVDQILYGLNTGCTREAGEPDHAGNTSGSSIWYKFTAPASGDYTVIAWQSTLLNDAVTAIYTGSSVGALTEIASDLAFAWEITFTAVEGTDYYIAQEGLDGEEGFLSLSVVAA